MSNENIARLNDMIADIEIAMLTSVGGDGELHSRPMTTQRVELDGTMYFFTSAGAAAAYESEKNCRVNVSYVDQKRSTYVSVSGLADVIDDRKKIEELWDPRTSAWFPKGVEDPDLRLLRISISRAEFWDAAQNALALLVGYARQAITGKNDGIGTHERIV